SERALRNAARCSRFAVRSVPLLRKPADYVAHRATATVCPTCTSDLFGARQNQVGRAVLCTPKEWRPQEWSPYLHSFTASVLVLARSLSGRALQNAGRRGAVRESVQH